MSRAGAKASQERKRLEKERRRVDDGFRAYEDIIGRADGARLVACDECGFEVVQCSPNPFSEWLTPCLMCSCATCTVVCEV